MKTKTCALVITLALSSILSGCTGAIVGGAATGVAIAHDRRDSITIFKDEELEWKIAHKIFAVKELDVDSHINITAYNKFILLTGEVIAEDLKLRANAMTAQTEGVKQVFNELSIKSPSSLLSRSNDTYLTAKVKLSLLDTPVEKLDLSHIKIVTEDSVVYMLGLVTEKEADTATNLARSVSGVKKVVKLFEYIEQKPK